METKPNPSSFNKNQKIELAFNFFSEKKLSKQYFTVDEIANKTGWGQSTVKTYLSKNGQHL